MPAPPPPPFAEPEYQGERRGQSFVAWVLIIVAVGVQLLLPHLLPRTHVADTSARRVEDVTFRLQGRVIVGFNQMQRDMGNPESMADQADQFNAGSIDQRLRGLVLVCELAGPSIALRQLEVLEDRLEARNREPSPDQSRAMKLLASMWRQRENELPANLPAADAAFLRRELGWFGELALAPPDAPAAARSAAMEPALRATAVIVALVLIVGVAGLGGFVGLIVFTVLARQGRLTLGLAPGSPHGGIYAETFAVWMGVFLGGSTVAAWLAPPQWRLGAGFVSAMFSLVALAWPVIRGIPWSQVRRDIGWTAGRKPWAEPFVGIACWAMCLPALVLYAMIAGIGSAGALASFDEFEPLTQPAHPIVGLVGDWWQNLQIFLAACVAAPIVEETFFRGVLYRHLRTATRHNPGFAGAAVSALLSGTVFALIHPQGWIALPMLGILACGFCLAREWRDSLTAAIAAHALNNGVVLGVFLLAMN